MKRGRGEILIEEKGRRDRMQYLFYFKNKAYICVNRAHHASQRCVPRWDLAFYEGWSTKLGNTKMYESKRVTKFIRLFSHTLIPYPFQLILLQTATMLLPRQGQLFVPTTPPNQSTFQRNSNLSACFCPTPQ